MTWDYLMTNVNAILHFAILDFWRLRRTECCYCKRKMAPYAHANEEGLLKR